VVTNYARGILHQGLAKPKEDYIKLNVDASFDADRELFIRCSILPFVEGAVTAEAAALRDGMTSGMQ
jgi:hypothetical protein